MTSHSDGMDMMQCTSGPHQVVRTAVGRQNSGVDGVLRWKGCAPFFGSSIISPAARHHQGLKEGVTSRNGKQCVECE
jgi:hypothetical protein